MNKYLLAGFALLGLILVAGADSSAKVSRKRIDNVLAKLALYERGDDLGELSMEELEAAHKEYNSWPAEVRETVRSQEPLMKLLHDFLMAPMDTFRQQVGHHEEDPMIRRGFVERLQVNYKRFKPLYFGLRNKNTYMRAPKTEALMSAVFELKDAPALTGKMVEAAKNEYLAMKAKADEIVDFEDVYASLSELEKLKNYLNRDQVKIMLNGIFPLFTGVKTFNDEVASAIKKASRKELKKTNLVIDDGQLKQVVYVDKYGNPVKR